MTGTARVPHLKRKPDCIVVGYVTEEHQLTPFAVFRPKFERQESEERFRVYDYPQDGFAVAVDASNLPKSALVLRGWGIDMAYIATDRSGRFLLAASYPNNKVTVNPIAPDGTVQAPKQVVPTEPNAHDANFSLRQNGPKNSNFVWRQTFFWAFWAIPTPYHQGGHPPALMQQHKKCPLTFRSRACDHFCPYTDQLAGW